MGRGSNTQKASAVYFYRPNTNVELCWQAVDLVRVTRSDIAFYYSRELVWTVLGLYQLFSRLPGLLIPNLGGDKGTTSAYVSPTSVAPHVQ